MTAPVRPRFILAPAWNGLDALGHLAASGWPYAGNTGVPSGTTLTATSGTVTTSANSQVIQALDLSGHIVVNHTGVTVKNCRIQSDSFWAVTVNAGTCTIQDCTMLSTGGNLGAVQCFTGTTVSRCDISQFENGIRVWGFDDCTLQDNYIHDFLADDPPNAHYDALELFGGSNIAVRHNTLILDQIETSCVNLAPDSGTNVGYVVDGNLVDGGGWIMNIRNNQGPLTGVQITNNRFGDNHSFGYATIDSGTVSLLSGNVRDLTGVNVDGEM